MQNTPSLTVSVILVGLGLIHLAPAFGVLGANYLSNLYGINADEPNLQILMRHRAVLFAILAGFIFYSIWQPELRMIALLLALISTLSFCALCWQIGDYNAQLKKVLWIDLIAALGALIASVVASNVVPSVTTSSG